MSLGRNRPLAFPIFKTRLFVSGAPAYQVEGPTMAVVRDLFVKPVSLATALWVLGHCLLFFLIIGLLAVGSVVMAVWLFSKMTRSIPEQEEIVKDNLAVAILFAFVLLAITAILNEGLEDLARSIIPYAESGLLQIR